MRRAPTAVLVEFSNGDTVRLEDCDEGHVEDAAGQRVPLGEVLPRLASGEVLYAIGTGRTMRKRECQPWEDADAEDDDTEPVGDPFPVRALLHLAGISYASELYKAPDLRVA